MSILAIALLYYYYYYYYYPYQYNYLGVGGKELLRSSMIISPPRIYSHRFLDRRTIPLVWSHSPEISAIPTTNLKISGSIEYDSYEHDASMSMGYRYSGGVRPERSYMSVPSWGKEMMVVSQSHTYNIIEQKVLLSIPYRGSSRRNERRWFTENLSLL